jgi:hypothetical protein
MVAGRFLRDLPGKIWARDQNGKHDSTADFWYSEHFVTKEFPSSRFLGLPNFFFMANFIFSWNMIKQTNQQK